MKLITEYTLNTILIVFAVIAFIMGGLPISWSLGIGFLALSFLKDDKNKS